MANMSDYLRAAALNHFFRNVATTAPAAVYGALCTADPTSAGTGASMHELPNAGAYARTAMVFGAPSVGQIVNTTTTYPTASADWGTITHLAILDTGTYGAGNMLMSGALAVAKTVTAGDVIQFPAGQVTITFS